MAPSSTGHGATKSTSVRSCFVFLLLCCTSALAVSYNPGLESAELPEGQSANPLGLGLGLGTSFGTWGGTLGQEEYTPRHKSSAVSISALGGAKQSKAQKQDSQRGQPANSELQHKSLMQKKPQPVLQENRNVMQKKELATTGIPGKIAGYTNATGDDQATEAMNYRLLHQNDQELILKLEQQLSDKRHEVGDLKAKEHKEVEALKAKEHAAEAHVSLVKAQLATVKTLATHRLERKGNKIKILGHNHSTGIGSGWETAVEKKFEESVFGQVQNHARRDGWGSRMMRSAKDRGESQVLEKVISKESNLGQISGESNSSKSENDPDYGGCHDYAGYYVTGANETLNLMQHRCDVTILVQNHSLHLDQTESNGTGHILPDGTIVLPGHGINGTSPNESDVPDPDKLHFGHVKILWNNGDVWLRKMCNDFGGIYWEGDTRMHLIQDACGGKIVNTRDLTQEPYNVTMRGNEINISRFERTRLQEMMGQPGEVVQREGWLDKDLLTLHLGTYPVTSSVWLRNSSTEQPDDHADTGVHVDTDDMDPHAAERAEAGDLPGSSSNDVS